MNRGLIFNIPSQAGYVSRFVKNKDTESLDIITEYPEVESKHDSFLYFLESVDTVMKKRANQGKSPFIDESVLHTGTNDLMSGIIAQDRLQEVVDILHRKSKEAKIVLSSVATMSDISDMQSKVSTPNRSLKTVCALTVIWMYHALVRWPSTMAQKAQFSFVF